MALRGESSSSDSSSSGSPLPSQPLHAAGDLPDLPLASSLNDDAKSPSTLKVHNRPCLVPFNPDAAQTHALFEDLLDSTISFDELALRHNTTAHALAIWLDLAENQASMDRIERMTHRRNRLIAASHMNDAITSLTYTLKAHIYDEANEPSGRSFDAVKLRQRMRTDARKASWLLFRISRAHPAIPVDPNTLRFINTLKHEGTASVNERMSPDSDSCATGCLSTSANTFTSTPPYVDRTPSVSEPFHRTANVSERMSSSGTVSVNQRISSSGTSLSSPTLDASDETDALLDLTPALSNDDADSRGTSTSVFDDTPTPRARGHPTITRARTAGPDGVDDEHAATRAIKAEDSGIGVGAAEDEIGEDAA